MNFLIIGPGYISQRYVDKIAALENARVVAVVGRHPDKTRRYAQRHNIAVYGTDLESVVNEAHPEAAIICTPNALHHDTVLAAAGLGIHCLCEKPLDISRERQNEMIDTCRRKSVVLAVAYIHRFHRHLQYTKSLIESGALGKILVVDAAVKLYRAPGYYAESSWHGTWGIDGGGPFIQQGSHVVDLILWLAGEYEEVLAAKSFSVFHDIEVEDHGYAVIRYKSGAVGMIEASTACRGVNQQIIEVIGTKGHVTADLEKIIRFEVEGSSLPERELEEDVFTQLLNDFIESIELNREPFVTGESAKATTELILDIYMKAGPVIGTF
jgi:predicted dehydrogenase